MSRPEKTLEKILSGFSDANLAFSDLNGVLVSLGFKVRIRGGHHIFSREDVPEILNLQPKNNKAKPYQVRQVRLLLQRILSEGSKPGGAV